MSVDILIDWHDDFWGNQSYWFYKHVGVFGKDWDVWPYDDKKLCIRLFNCSSETKTQVALMWG